jgi:hypothetical protein
MDIQTPNRTCTFTSGRSHKSTFSADFNVEDTDEVDDKFKIGAECDSENIAVVFVSTGMPILEG